MLAKPFSAFPLQISNINFETYIVKILDSQPEFCSKRLKRKNGLYCYISMYNTHNIQQIPQVEKSTSLKCCRLQIILSKITDAFSNRYVLCLKKRTKFWRINKCILNNITRFCPRDGL